MFFSSLAFAVCLATPDPGWQAPFGDQYDSREPRWDSGPLAFVDSGSPLNFVEQVQHDDLVLGGFELFDLANRPDGPTTNAVMSPYVVQTVMAGVYAGAVGQTAEQIAAALRWRHLPHDALMSMGALEQRLAAQVAEENVGASPAGAPPSPQFIWGKPVEMNLDIASRLWPSTDAAVYPTFSQWMSQSGLTVDAQPLDYGRDPEAARQAVNTWTSEKTHHLIPQLLPPDSVTQDTGIIISTALYFQAEWTKRFVPVSPQDFSFRRPHGDAVATAGMSVTTKLPILRAETFTAVDVPYGRGNFSMLFVLPHATADGGLPNITFAPADYARFFEQAHHTDVRLTLPAFSLRQSQGLVKTFEQLGMIDAFNPGRADFSHLLVKRPGQNNLFISAMQKEAFIEVTPRGTRAGAAVAVVATFGCSAAPTMPVTVDIDRPFFFILHDRQTRTPLFLGRVMDPTLPP